MLAWNVRPQMTSSFSCLWIPGQALCSFLHFVCFFFSLAGSLIFYIQVISCINCYYPNITYTKLNLNVLKLYSTYYWLIAPFSTNRWQYFLPIKLAFCKYKYVSIPDNSLERTVSHHHMFIYKASADHILTPDDY